MFPAGGIGRAGPLRRIVGIGSRNPRVHRHIELPAVEDAAALSGRIERRVIETLQLDIDAERAIHLLHLRRDGANDLAADPVDEQQRQPLAVARAYAVGPAAPAGGVEQRLRPSGIVGRRLQRSVERPVERRKIADGQLAGSVGVVADDRRAIHAEHQRPADADVVERRALRVEQSPRCMPVRRQLATHAGASATSR